MGFPRSIRSGHRQGARIRPKLAGIQCASTQVRAAAYPTLRPLRVAKGLGNQAIVGSICPTNLADPTSADYAYRPTIDAIVDRVSGTLIEQP